MIGQYGYPRAVFTGALWNKMVGSWQPAHAVLSDGMVTLWAAGSTGWVLQFHVPVREAVVKSAAQRITLQVRGNSYPILADIQAVYRSLGYSSVGLVGALADIPALQVGGAVGSLATTLGTGPAFDVNGGGEFIAAMRYSGARVSRISYGGLVAIGIGAGVMALILFLVIVVAVVM